MTLKPIAAVAALVFCVIASPVEAQQTYAVDDTHVGTVAESWEAGMTQYARGNYWQAYGHLFAAAMRDHAEAQEVIGLMRLYGPELYGQEIARDRDEATFWLGEAARQGREAALHVHCALTAQRQQAFAAVIGVQPDACRAG